MNDQEVLADFLHIIESRPSLQDQVQAVRTAAADKRWTKDELQSLQSLSAALARQSPVLCQHVLMLLTEAAPFWGDKHYEGTCFLNAGNTFAALCLLEGDLSCQLRAAAAFQDCGDFKLAAAAWVNAGNAFARSGSDSRALEFYDRALPYFQQQMEPAHYSNLLGCMGQVLTRLNRHSEAIEKLRAAVALLEEADPRRADLELQLGQSLRASGKTADATAVHASLADRKGTNSLAALHSLANDHLHAGRWQAAMDAYLDLLREAERSSDDASQALALHGVGNCRMELRQVNESLEAFERGLRLAEKVPDKKIAAVCHEGIAQGLMRLDRRIDAADHLSRGITLATEAHDRASAARMLGNLAICQMSREPGAMQGVITTLERGISMAASIGDASEVARQTLLLTDSLKLLGWIHLTEGGIGPSDDFMTSLYAQTEKALDTAISAAEQHGDPNQLLSLCSRAAIFYELERALPAKAIPYYQKAIELHEALSASIITFGSQRAANPLAATDYGGIVHCFLRQGDIEAAWNYVERGRARSLLRALSEGGVRLRPRADNRIAQRLEAAERGVEHALNESGPDKCRGLSKAAGERNRTILEIAGDDLAFATTTGVANSTLADLQRLLPRSTAVLEYYLMPASLQREEMSFVFVLTSDELFCVDLSISGSQLADLVSAFRRSLLPRSSLGQLDMPGAVPDDRPWQELSNELHRILIDPADKFLQGMDSLWIVPSGPLHYLPFGAVWSGTFLIERFQLAILPSLNSLRFLKSWTPATGSRLAALVNPAYQEAVARLPGTAKEATVIRLNGNAPTVFSDGDANVPNAREACSNANVVHIASHAVFTHRRPFDSYVYLSPSPDDKNAGRWEVKAILQEKVSAQLIVLSACESLLPDTGGGDELLGLSYAFLYAGASTVIGSLWKVSDDACPFLMEEFYRNLGKEHVGEALRKAQMKMITSSQYSSPWYWAAFHIVGLAEFVREGSDAVEPEDLKRSAIRALEAGAHVLALRYLDVLCQRCPADNDTLTLRGLACQLCGHNEEARRCYERALEVGGEPSELSARIGMLCLELGDLDSAASHFRAALRHTPDDARVLANFAALLGKLRRFDESLRFADRALEVEPTLAGALKNKAIALYGLDRLDESIAASLTALGIDSDDVSMLVNLGLAYTRKLKFRGARRSLLRALDLDPKNALAKEILRKAREIEVEVGPISVPEPVGKLLRRAEQKLKSGDKMGAVDLARKATTLVNESALVWANLGSFQGFAGLLQEARDSYLRSLSLDETDPDVWMNLAYVNSQIGDLKEARRAVAKALVIDEKMVRGHVLRGQLLLIEGRKEEALAALRHALELAPEDGGIRELIRQAELA